MLSATGANLAPVKMQFGESQKNLDKKKWSLRGIISLVGLAFFIFTLVSDAPVGLKETGWRTLGVAVFMASLWVSEFIPFAVTALLPFVIFPLAGISSAHAAAAPYANPIIFLFLGGLLLALAMESSGLQRRMALSIIGVAGVGKSQIIAGFLTASAFLSMWVSNTAVAVMMLPMAVSVLHLFEQKNDKAFSSAVLLAVAYGAGIGGMATLVGTPPNAVMAGFLREEHQIAVGFLGWLKIGLPVAILLLLAAWWLLTKISFSICGSKSPDVLNLLKHERAKLGVMSRAEFRVAIIFGMTSLLWCLRPILQSFLPALSDASIAMASGILLFLIPSGAPSQGYLLQWEGTKKLPIDVLLIIGGGLSLAAAIQENGLAEWIGQRASGFTHLPFPAMLLLVIFFVICIAEITSNTATAAALLPVVSSMAAEMSESPLRLATAVTLAGSCGFMLPVSTPANALIYGSGRVPLPVMIRTGFWLDVLAWIILSAWISWFAPFRTIAQ